MNYPRYPFEGEQLLVSEILARVPALSESSVRRRLALGLDSRQAMLAWDEGAARRRAGRAGRRAAEAMGALPSESAAARKQEATRR